MAAIKVKPGRARVSLKIWTESMTIDGGGAYMSREAALVIYQIYIGDGLPWADELSRLRTLQAAFKVEKDKDALAVLAQQITMAAAVLADAVEQCGRHE